MRLVNALGVALAMAYGMAGAAEIRLLSSTGMRSGVIEVLPEVERASGHKVAVASDTGNPLLTRIQGGENAAAVVLTGPTMDELAKSGRVSGAPVALAPS